MYIIVGYINKKVYNNTMGRGKVSKIDGDTDEAFKITGYRKVIDLQKKLEENLKPMNMNDRKNKWNVHIISKNKKKNKKEIGKK